MKKNIKKRETSQIETEIVQIQRKKKLIKSLKKICRQTHTEACLEYIH